MDEPINYKGYTILIKPDDCPESPRAWDNLGIMVCFHERYNLGDKYGNKHYYKVEHFNGWQDFERHIWCAEDPVAVIPIYMYDHSSLCIRAGRSFGDVDPGHWDSGMIGFIYAPKADVRKEWNVQRISCKLKQTVIGVLMAEVTEYAQYVEGDVWGYVIRDWNDNEIDSCWGFYGYDYCLQEAQSIVDDKVEQARLTLSTAIVQGAIERADIAV